MNRLFPLGLSRSLMACCRPLAIAALGCSFLVSVGLSSAAQPGEAGWPDRELAKFVFERLDISSFRNSTGPRRKPGQRHFADLGIHPTKLTDTTASSDERGEWFFQIRVLGKSDYNKDGAQEVAICFSESAQNGGRYRAVSHYVLQLVEGRAVALAYTEDSLAESSNCRSSR